MMMESSAAPRFGSHRVRRSLFVERSRWQLPVFIAVIAANVWGVSLRDLKLAVAWGLGGAFATVSVLALIKATIARI